MTRRFPVPFQTAGQHQITARCKATPWPPTTFARSWSIFPRRSVLVIDGDAKRQDAFFLSTAIAPGGKITSGLRPVIETPRYLRDHSLAQFDTIYLLNIARLEPAEVERSRHSSRRAAGLASSWASCRRPRFSTSVCIAMAKGYFQCRWQGRPSCSSIDSKKLPTWK